MSILLTIYLIGAVAMFVLWTFGAPEDTTGRLSFTKAGVGLLWGVLWPVGLLLVLVERNVILLTCKFFAWLWSKRPFQPCRHRHFTCHQTFTFDGTPWSIFECHDCGYFDRGHVYGPSRGQPGSEGWERVIRQ